MITKRRIKCENVFEKKDVIFIIFNRHYKIINFFNQLSKYVTKIKKK